jgi:type IV pilus assembly protein PilY1
VWRFDINPHDDPFDSDYDPDHVYVQRVITLKDSLGNPQPITTAPELGMIQNERVIFVGTGQLLGMSDTATTTTQSLYAIKDIGFGQDAAPHPDPRTVQDEDDKEGSSNGKLFVKQQMTGSKKCTDAIPYCETGAAMVTVTRRPVDWKTQNGWFVDFPVGGERVNTRIQLLDGVLAITTNKPQSGACVPAGISFSYYLDYKTGGYVNEGTDGYAGSQTSESLGNAAIFGVDENGGSTTGLKGCDGEDCRDEEIPPPPPKAGRARRVSWRELIVE